MTTFKHYIVTSFNLRGVYNNDRDKNNKSTCTEEWLSTRFGYFDKYCFPSVSQQTNKEFVWLCLFDKDTPEKYVDLVKQYEKRCPQMSAQFLNDEEMPNWVDYIKGIIKSTAPDGVDYILTTNVDNDDSIHLNFVEKLQEEFRKQPSEAVYSFVNGYQYFVRYAMMLRMYYPHNHFHTLTSKYADDINTVGCERHGRMRKRFKPIDIKTDSPYWIEFVHATNVNNDLRITSRIKYYPVFKTLSLKDYGLDILLPKNKNINNALFNLPGLFVKTAFRKVVKKMFKQKKKK